MTIIERCKNIMVRITKHPSFKDGHERVDFGRGYVGYYINGTDMKYYALKYASVEITILNGEITRVQTGWARNKGYVDFGSWLLEIEGLIPPKEKTEAITVDGVRYVREDSKGEEK